MKPKRYRQIIFWLQKFEDVVRLDEMKGSMRPEEWRAVEKDYPRIKAKLIDLIGELE